MIKRISIPDECNRGLKEPLQYINQKITPDYIYWRFYCYTTVNEIKNHVNPLIMKIQVQTMYSSVTLECVILK